MAQKKGLGALEFARVPLTRPFDDRYFEPGKYEALREALYEYQRDDKARGLADVEYAADMLKDQGFRPDFRAGLSEIERITGGDFGDVINYGEPTSVFAMDESGKIRNLEFGDRNLAKERSEELGRDVAGLINYRGFYKKGPLASDSLDAEGNFFPSISINPDVSTFSRFLSDTMKGRANLSPEEEKRMMEELYKPVRVPDQSGDEGVTVAKQDARSIAGHEISHLGQKTLKEHPSFDSFMNLSNTFTQFLRDPRFRNKVGGDVINNMEHAMIYAMDQGSEIRNKGRKPVGIFEERNAKIYDTYMKLKDQDITARELMFYFKDALIPQRLEGSKLKGKGFSNKQRIQMLKDMFESGEAVAVMALISKKMADEVTAARRRAK